MKTILVVDDEPLIRELLSDLIAEFGYLTRTASSGIKALEILVSGDPINLVVSDVRMPHMDGLQFLLATRTLATPSPPVILMTGYADLDELKAKAAGAAALLSKPINMELLKNILHLYLGKDGDSCHGDGAHLIKSSSSC